MERCSDLSEISDLDVGTLHSSHGIVFVTMTLVVLVNVLVISSPGGQVEVVIVKYSVVTIVVYGILEYRKGVETPAIEVDLDIDKI